MVWWWGVRLGCTGATSRSMVHDCVNLVDEIFLEGGTRITAGKILRHHHGCPSCQHLELSGRLTALKFGIEN